MKRLIVVDISNFIFRAFFAIRPLHSPDGVPTNAVHGVMSMMLRLLSDYQPTHMFIARDTKGGSFRNEQYPEYKANRSAPPEDLVPQFALIEELTNKMDFKSLGIKGFEADDVIGSAVTQWREEFDEILIASGDKDLMQFVDDKIKMLDTMKNKILGKDEVFEKMGVWPDQIVDYLSMLGDTSDNIPGMRGIGAKGAAKLLSEHKTFDECINQKDTFKGKKLTTAFSEHLEDGLMSRELIKIVTDIDLISTPTDLEYGFDPSAELKKFCEDLGLKGQLKKLDDISYGEAQADENASENGPSEEVVSHLGEFENITDQEGFKKVLELIETSSAIAVYPIYAEGELYSLSFSFNGKTAYLVNVSDFKNIEELINATWCNETIEIFGDYLKRDMIYLLNNKKQFKAQSFDITQVHYTLMPDEKHNVEKLSENYLSFNMPDLEYDLGNRVIAIYQLSDIFKKELKEKKLDNLYYEMDDPLIKVLSKMQTEGVLLNVGYLEELSENYQKQLKQIHASILKEIDNEEYNDINLKSPKQLSELFFDVLGYPVIKKTKTGYSTDSEVLTELDERGVGTIPGLVLQYRELDKLVSTYIKAIPELLNPKTKRIHTHFNQHVAATGRLSSDKPNLQNIPVRTENGKRIRKAFIAAPGKILLAADYSQVELRLLAHFSGDETMLKAFNNNEDIHAQTASEILDIPLDKITSEDRSKAKAVNFGLMYGQSSFGLAKSLRITRGEAKDYITKYFERFHNVKSYLDSLKEICEEKGYSETMYGRKRLLPDIHSRNRNIKAMAERVAVNSPIQGTAADIIKLAMLRIDKEISSKKLKSKMILQVHDELIFEVPENELETMKKLVKDGMEKIVELKVPLDVQMGFGVNWYDLK